MRRVSILMIAALSLLAPGISTGGPGARGSVTGSVQLDDGGLFQIAAGRAGTDVIGQAWLAEAGSDDGFVELTIDCLEIRFEQPVYPIPPYLPYHVAEASGVAADGTRTFITAFDLVARPIGFGDRLILDSRPGEGACGAPESIGSPIAAGEITIVS